MKIKRHNFWESNLKNYAVVISDAHLTYLIQNEGSSTCSDQERVSAFNIRGRQDLNS